MSSLDSQLEASINSLNNLSIHNYSISEPEIEELKLIALNQLLHDSQFFNDDSYNTDYSDDGDDSDASIVIENNPVSYSAYEYSDNKTTACAVSQESNYLPIYQVYLNQQEQEQLEYMKNNNTFCISDYLYWYFNIVEERRFEGRLITSKKYKTK
jgi:hypothetical protein